MTSDLKTPHTSSPHASLPRLNNIQALRGLAAIMVLFSHLLIIENKYSQDTILPKFLSFGMSGVDIFFVISGFIMVYVTHKWQGAAGRHIPEFLFARAARIYPLYWVVSGALLMVYLVKPQWVFSSSAGNDPNIIKSFLLWPDHIAYPLLEVGWTLIHEMGFYLVFAGLLLLPRRLRPYGICLWAAGVIGGYLLGVHTAGPVAKILFHPLSLEFCVGALLAFICLKPLRINAAMPVLIISTILFVASILAHIKMGLHHPGAGWLRVGTFGVASLTILLTAYLFEQQGKTAPRWSVIIGDWSYALYLTHVLSLSLIGRIWAGFDRAGFDRTGVLDNLIMLPLMLIGALIVAGLAHKLIETPIMRATKYMRQNYAARRTDSRS